MSRREPIVWVCGVCLALLLPGCGEEKARWLFGVSLIISCLVLLVVTEAVAWVHRQGWFPRVALLLKPVVLGGGCLLTAAGMGIFLLGFRALSDEEVGQEKLVSFVGMLALAAGAQLIQWARCDEPERKRSYARRVSLILSFAIPLALVAFRGWLPYFD